MFTENLSTLKINVYNTQEQYDREKEAGNINENELHLTPEGEGVTKDELDKAIAKLSEEIVYQQEETKKIDNLLNSAINGGVWTHTVIGDIVKLGTSKGRCAFPVSYFKNDVEITANDGYYIASILLGTSNVSLSDSGWCRTVEINAYDNVALNLRKQDNSEMTDEEVKNAITISIIEGNGIEDKAKILTELDYSVMNRVVKSCEAISPSFRKIEVIKHYKLEHGHKYTLEGECEIDSTEYSAYLTLYDSDGNELCVVAMRNGVKSGSVDYISDKDCEDAYVICQMSVESGMKVKASLKRNLKDSMSAEKAMLKSEKALSLFDFFTKPCYHHLNQEITSAIPAQSLYDIQYAKKLGFDLIEVNEHLCSDGVYVCKHGVSGKLGNALKSVDGNDYSNTAFSSVTSTWLRENITYNSPVHKYQGSIPTLDEFCSECNNLDMKVKIGSYDALDIVRKYLPDNMIWITSYYEREKSFSGVIEYVWDSGRSVSHCISNCMKIGAPLNIVIAAGTFDTRTDEEISELVTKAHECGFTVGFVYPTPNSIMRAKKLGVDVWGSTGIDINPFDVGTKFNIVDLSDENLTLSNGTYDPNNDVITVNTGGSISVNSDSFKSGILSVKVRYSGNISIKGSTNENQNLNNYESDGMSEIVYAVVLQRKTESYTRWVEIVANASTEIYDIDIRCSRI